jgi:glutamine cyclotransferase
MACGSEKKSDQQEVKPIAPTEKLAIPVLDYSVVATLPHDTMSFTEGLLVNNSQIFESTGTPAGSNFKSLLGPVDQKSGKINAKVEIDGKTYFGEGMVFLKGKIYQVTYQNHVGFVYDEKSYRKIGQFNYTGEGWGMTTDSTYIIMSDGTEMLRYFDTEFKPVKTLTVTENGYAKESINELEYINGYIYANIWMTGDIVKIDPATGKIVARINLTPLSYEVKNFHPTALEMNGIAFDATNNKIYVTGKAWPKIYEINFQH